ncbi:hypothetical protein D3C85_1453400 [compost metagenome]
MLRATLRKCSAVSWGLDEYTSAGITMMPSTPTRSTALATLAAPALVNSAMPQITGTRPPDASLATSVTAIFSSMVSEVFSPTLPHTTRPDTPSRTRLEMTLWVSSRFTEKSALNWVVTAGNTPLQLTFLLMGNSVSRD